ncbi:MAG: DUF4411 family protein [Balneolales bacterium]
MNGITYILDANVLIEPWLKYYAPSFCTGYFQSLEKLGDMRVIGIPEMVKREIAKTEDTLFKWLDQSSIPILQGTIHVQSALKSIYAADPRNIKLTDTSRNRSMADPWVIAHALAEQATVVTKEEKILIPDSKKVKIPNVCEIMGITCIQDYEFIREVNIRLMARLVS